MRRRLVLLALVPALAVALWGPPAAAHTEFESSDPADGAVLDGPVDTVTLVFTADAEPAGEGFEVLDPSGRERAPSVASPDGRTFVLRFDEPLAGGVVGVRWSVRAGDAHPIQGAFAFTAGPAPTTTTAGTGGAAAPPAPAGPTTTAGSGGAVASGGQDGAAEAPVGAEELAAFLEEEQGTAAADALAALGRTLQLLGSVVGLGALAFATWVLRGGRRDLAVVLAWARWGAALVLAGSVVRLGARAVIAEGGDWAGVVSPSALGDVLGSTMGISLLLAVAGAVLLGLGARTGPGAPGAVVPSPVGAASAGDAVAVVAAPVTRSRSRPRPWQPPAAAVAGALGLLGSFLFDGHTVTEGNRVVHALVDVVHVGSAAVWGGGVLMLAAVARRRRRAGDATRVAALAARFSVTASVALVAAGLAGVALSVIVADSVSDLWSTAWGRLLLVKVALVGVAAAIGAWNHFVMVPQLDEHPDDPALLRRFTGVLRAESAALVAVVVVTGLLVGASTT